MGKKRRLRPEGNGGLQSPFHNHILCLAFLAALLPGALSQFNDCVDRMLRNDLDQDYLLTKEEFQSFVYDMSNGKVSLAMENDDQHGVHQSFLQRAVADRGGVDLSAQDGVFLPLFCENVYKSLFPMFHVKVRGEECRAALRQTENGQALNASGFINVASLLLGDTFQTRDLGLVFWTVFHDFQDSNGLIQPAVLARPPLANIFCRRIVLGAMLDDDQVSVDVGGAPGPKQFLSLPPTLAHRYLLSNIEMTRCKTFLFVSDGDKNLQVNQEEYVAFVNRLTVNTFFGFSFLDLPVFFRDAFDASSNVGGYISIIGSRPNQGATPDQLEALEAFCEDAYDALTAWELAQTNKPTTSPTSGSTTVPIGGSTSSPVGVPSVSGPTPAPTYNIPNFPYCTTSMAVSDRNQDQYLGEEEFVGLLNRLSQNMFLGLAFQSIDPALQSVFFALRDSSGSIGISGARPGQPRSPEESAWLRRICGETLEAIDFFKTTFVPTARPPSQPTLAPTRTSLTPDQTVAPAQAPSSPVQPSPTLTPVQFARCRGSLNAADGDRDRELTQIEFVKFLNLVSGNEFRDFEFSDLGDIFQEIFTTDQTDQGTLRIPGQLTSLTIFCTVIFDALESNQPTPTQAPTAGKSPVNSAQDPVVRDCLRALAIADANSDDSIDQLEYVVLVSLISDSAYSVGLPYPSLPFVVQENFNWVRGETSSIDIRGVDEILQLNSTTHLVHLARVCRRTDKVVSSATSGNNATDFNSHCYSSFAVSDQNNDDRLNKTEFTSMIHYFQGLDQANLDSETPDDPFMNVFEVNKESSSGSLNIEGSKPSDTPTVLQELSLEYLCGEMAKALVEARENYVLLSRCSNALVYANENNDDLLTETEYVVFVYTFSGRDPRNTTFIDLSGKLQLNFEALRSPDAGSINIEGWRGAALSGEERKNLKTVCSATESAVLGGFPSDTPTLSPGETSLATVYNGFVLQVREDLFVGEFEKSNFEDLEQAYKQFLNTTLVPLLPNSRLRGRRLSTISLSYTSPRVYKIDDGVCIGQTGNSSTTCKKAYARFDLILSEGVDVTSTMVRYTNLTQDSIANGALQAQLEVLFPDRGFDVVGIAESVLPDTKSPTVSPNSTIAPTSAPDQNNLGPRSEANDDDGGFQFIQIGAGIVAGVLVLGFLWFWYKRRQKQQTNTVGDFFGKDQGGRKQRDDKHNDTDGDQDISVESSEKSPMNDLLGPSSSDHLMPAASEHTRVESKFTFSTGDDDGFGFSKSVSSHHEESPWGDAAVQIANETSEGSEESELVVRSSAISFSGSRTSSHSGSREMKPSASRFFGGSENSNEGSMGLPGSDEGSGTFRDAGDSFGNDDYDDNGGYGDDYDGDDNDYRDEYGDEQHEPSYDNEEDGSTYTGSVDDERADDQSHSLDEDDTIQDSYRADSGRGDRIVFRDQIKALVLQVVPDEVENVDAMMEQFYGREPELIKTLETMAKQVGRRGGGSGAGRDIRDESGRDSYGSYGESYYSGSQQSMGDGFGERFDDEGDHDSQSFGRDEEGDSYDDGFNDEGSYGSDYDE